MKRMSDLERKYVSEALDNEFNSSLNSVFNNRLEQAFAKTFGCQYAIGHMNGTATLHTALVAGGVKPGDEVIVPPPVTKDAAEQRVKDQALKVTDWYFSKKKI